jgi:hypothetical protein
MSDTDAGLPVDLPEQAWRPLPGVRRPILLIDGRWHRWDSITFEVGFPPSDYDLVTRYPFPIPMRFRVTDTLVVVYKGVTTRSRGPTTREFTRTGRMLYRHTTVHD